MSVLGSINASLLLAESSDLPVGKAVAMILFFGAIGVFATVCAFAPRRTLTDYANIIGTKNPTVARIVCLVAAIVGWGVVLATVLSLSGALK